MIDPGLGGLEPPSGAFASSVGVWAQSRSARRGGKDDDSRKKSTVKRVGKKVQIQYLVRLLLFVSVGVAVGLVIQLCCFPGYGAVLAASMVGAWISVAAFRRQVVLEDVPQFMASKYEPAVRLCFVGLVACAVALFVKTGLLAIVLGDLNLVEFPSKPEVALILGLVAGISEKKISVQLIQKAREAIPSSKK